MMRRVGHIYVYIIFCILFICHVVFVPRFPNVVVQNVVSYSNETQTICDIWHALKFAVTCICKFDEIIHYNT